MICLKSNRLVSDAIHVLYNQSEYRRKRESETVRLAKRGDVSPRGFAQDFFILGESESIMIICRLSLFLSTTSKSERDDRRVCLDALKSNFQLDSTPLNSQLKCDHGAAQSHHCGPESAAELHVILTLQL